MISFSKSSDIEWIWCNCVPSSVVGVVDSDCSNSGLPVPYTTEYVIDLLQHCWRRLTRVLRELRVRDTIPPKKNSSRRPIQ